MSCLFYAPPWPLWNEVIFQQILTLYQTMSTHILQYIILHKNLICAWRKQLRTKKAITKYIGKHIYIVHLYLILKVAVDFELVKLF